MRISKSKFVAGVQCLKRLYLEVHQPELAGEQREATQAAIPQGREVGLVAQTAFPGGLTVDAGHKDLNAALIQSLQLIANPEAPAIFEAAFEHGDVLVRTDVLQRNTRLGHRLIEVKSATSVKRYYVYDVALQMHVLTGASVEIEQINLMHLNRDYGFDGKAHDVSKLFVIAEISKDDAVSAVRQEISPQGPNAARLLRPPIEFMRTSVRYFIALAELGEVCAKAGLQPVFSYIFLPCIAGTI
jgi:hypothetical protein